SSGPVRWLVAALYTLVILSAPALIILAPIWVLRWWSSTTGPSRSWSRYMALTLLLVSALFIVSSESLGVINIRLGMALHDALNGLTYRAVTIAFLGLDTARALLTSMGWWYGYAIAILVVGCLGLAFALDPRPGKQVLGVYLLYVAIAA